MEAEIWKSESISSGNDDDLFEAIITAEEGTKLIAQVAKKETAKWIVDAHNLLLNILDEIDIEYNCLHCGKKFPAHDEDCPIQKIRLLVVEAVEHGVHPTDGGLCAVCGYPEYKHSAIGHEFNPAISG